MIAALEYAKEFYTAKSETSFVLCSVQEIIPATNGVVILLLENKTFIDKPFALTFPGNFLDFSEGGYVAISIASLEKEEVADEEAGKES